MNRTPSSLDKLEVSSSRYPELLERDIRLAMSGHEGGWQYPKAIIFDLMGTCLDWHSSITPKLKEATNRAAQGQVWQPCSEEDVSKLALEWRQGFFDEIHARFEAAESPEDIDTTHSRVLKRLLSEPRWTSCASVSDEAVETCVAAWHTQQGMHRQPPLSQLLTRILS